MTTLDPMLQKLDAPRGARQIVELMGVTLGQIYRLFRTPRIPITREGGFLVARRPKLRERYDGESGDG
jgi:hypothetical protein